MQHDSIQLSTAIQMFIDLLLEHREELEQHIKLRHRVEAKETLQQIQGKQTHKPLEADGDSSFTG